MNISELYLYAAEHQPVVRQALGDIDKQLAELHRAGLVLQQHRLSMLDDLAKLARLSAVQTITLSAP